MWPWEHVAFGYLLLTAFVHVRRRRSPAGRAVLVVVLATQLPDLIDKPLGWVFHVLPSGTSLAHSFVVGVPVVVAVALFAARRGYRSEAVALTLGYGSHLLGDVFYRAVVGGSASLSVFLWPLVPQSPEPGVPLAILVVHLLFVFVRFLTTPAGLFYLGFEVLFLATAFAAWVRDGTPGRDVIRTWSDRRPNERFSR